MAATDNKILALLGFNATGDLGPWTLYTSARHQIVFYPRVPNLNPPSPLQQIMRHRFTAAASLWQMKTPAERQTWETASKQASLKITGYNLWTYYVLTNDQSTIRTIEHQTQTSLLP